MTTLGQIVGIHKSTKTAIQRDWDTAYHTLQKGDLFTGITKEHEAFQGNLPQPDQVKRIQANAYDIISGLQPMLTRLIDLEATKDYADTDARADIIIGSTEILHQVPVNHLLWLEKQVVNLITVYRAIPVMSVAENWEEGQGLATGVWRTPTTETPSTTKVTDWKVIVQAAANGDHPADVRQVSEDVQTGTWRTVKFTAALPASTRDTLVKRAGYLLDAIRMATVAANHLTVTDTHEGDAIFAYLYEDLF